MPILKGLLLLGRSTMVCRSLLCKLDHITRITIMVLPGITIAMF